MFTQKEKCRILHKTSTRALEEKNDITIDTIESYFEKRPEVVAVYLFGSHAQGIAKPFSDIDLGILLDHKTLPLKDEFTTAYTVELGRLLRKDFHVLIMNTAGEMILSQVFKRGKCIHQKNQRILAKFKTASYSRIMDFEFQRKPIEKAFLSRLLGPSQ